MSAQLAWRVVVCCCALLASCAPTFDDDSARISEPRVLAVKSEPAEAKPGTSLSLTAFVALPDTATEAPTPSWSLCLAPKPPTEDNVVSAECVSGAALQPVGDGAAVVVRAPFNACALFGPDTPPGGFRPRDPDLTGGYYQPVRVDLAHTDPVFHLERITCNLGQANFDIAAQFGMSYVPNQNPHLAPLVASLGDEPLALDRIPSGASVVLDASWPVEDAESYTYYDRAAQTLTTKREAMRVAWYVSAGQLDTESNGRAEDDLALSTSNRWLAPSNPGAAKLWLVLRDSRGGVDFAAYDLAVVR